MKRCTVCYRQGRGFGVFAPGYHYTNKKRITEAKSFCSMQCLRIFNSHLKTQDNHMIDITSFEQVAIKATLQPLGDYVAEIGMQKPLADYTLKEIQTLVELVITTYQGAMKNEETYTKDKEYPY